MSPAPLPTSAVPLARIAETVHEAADAVTGSALVLVEFGEHDLTLGLWPVPEEVAHPTDVLVGWHAPPSTSAVGLITHGTAVRMPPGLAERPWFLFPPGQRVEPVRVTVLLARDGTAASVIDQPGRDPLVVPDAPQGWTADVLARTLGRATPPPRVTLAECVEATWLDKIATLVFEQDRDPRTWADLALLHPLAPPGPALPGALLAVEARALDLESDWGRMRLLGWGEMRPNPALHPPGGTPVPLGAWFDDGSLSRWTERNLVPADAVLDDLLESLSSSLGRELVDALTTVRPYHPSYLDLDDRDRDRDLDEDRDEEDRWDPDDPDTPCWCWPTPDPAPERTGDGA